MIRASKSQFDLVTHLRAHPTVGMRPTLVVEVDPSTPITDELAEPIGYPLP